MAFLRSSPLPKISPSRRSTNILRLRPGWRFNLIFAAMEKKTTHNPAAQGNKPAPHIFDQGQVLLIDKPIDWTSFDVVRKLRRQVKTKKVGHAGTLDPLATGLLFLFTGKYTQKFKDYNFVTPELVAATIASSFTGLILQTPPIHSAIKVNGQRVYELARKGKEVKLEPRPITIKEFAITGFQLPVLTFRVVCTTGTYIRSLANDLGAALGCNGYLSSLRRTRIGEFKVEDAMG